MNKEETKKMEELMEEMAKAPKEPFRERQPGEWGSYEKHNFIKAMKEKGLDKLTFLEFCDLMWYKGWMTYEHRNFAKSAFVEGKFGLNKGN